MQELNPQGDSIQEGTQQPVQQPVQPEPVQEPIVEPAQTIEQQPSFDENDLSQKVLDKVYPQIGDGVKTIMENQMEDRLNKFEERILEKLGSVSQVNPGKIVEEATPAKVETHTDLEPPKETVNNDELEALKAKVAQMESGSVENAIRNIPKIKELSSLNKTEAERFIGRAKAIAQANNISSSEVSRIFAEGSDIARDVNNQIVVLSQGHTNMVNKPINKPINTEITPKPDKNALINAFMAGRK